MLVQDVEREGLAGFRQGVDALLVLGEHRLPHHGAEVGLGEAVEKREPPQRSSSAVCSPAGSR